MPSTPFQIQTGKFGISLTDPTVTDACSATIADFNDFTCQITSGALNASPNVSDQTTPATWCDPEQTTPLVGTTSFEAAITFLQDPQIMQGLSRTLFEHDTESAWIFMGLDGDDPPKAVAKVRLTAGAFGGEARVSLTADVTMPCDGKPLICFGDATGSESVPVVPILTTLTPATFSIAAPTQITITGTGFTPTSTVHADGVLYPTGTYVSPTEMNFMPDAAAPGAQDITVRTGGITSNALPLTVTALAEEESDEEAFAT